MNKYFSEFGTTSLTYKDNDVMHRILGSTQQCGSIFLGNIEAAQNTSLLKKYNIGAVVSVIDYHVIIDPSISRLHIFAEDAEDFQLQRYFAQATKFIDQHREKTNILVHCYAGVSRSTTIVAAYLMMKYGWTVNFTLRHIQSSRPFIQPNEGFIEQLKQLEARSQRRQVGSQSISSINDLSQRPKSQQNTNLENTFLGAHSIMATPKNDNKEDRSSILSTTQIASLSKIDKSKIYNVQKSLFADLNERINIYQKKSRVSNNSLDQSNFTYCSLKSKTTQKENQTKSITPFTLSGGRSSYLTVEQPTIKIPNSFLTTSKFSAVQERQEKPIRSFLNSRPSLPCFFD